MEVKEAIKFIEDLEGCALHLSTIEEESGVMKKTKQVIALLKSLEAENQRLSGYEKMWKALPSIFEPALLSEDLDYMKEVMADTEKKYLGRR